MLYVTTINSAPTYTCRAVLSRAPAPDGGQFVPQALPQLTARDMYSLRQMPYHHRVAWLLGQFFDRVPGGREVEVALSGWAPKAGALEARTALVPLYAGETGTAAQIERRLLDLLGDQSAPSGWPGIAVWIGLLGGMLCNGTGGRICVAVCDDSLTLPLALWYCEQMGFPIQRVVCTLGEDSALWNLFSAGQLSLRRWESYPQGELANLQRLLWSALGSEPGVRLYWAVKNRGSFCLSQIQLQFLQSRLSAVVVGPTRPQALLGQFLRSGGRLLSLEAARSYCGLQDHRAFTGDGTPTLLFSTVSPGAQAPELLTALGYPVSKDPVTQLIRLGKAGG